MSQARALAAAAVAAVLAGGGGYVVAAGIDSDGSTPAVADGDPPREATPPAAVTIAVPQDRAEGLPALRPPPPPPTTDVRPPPTRTPPPVVVQPPVVQQ